MCASIFKQGDVKYQNQLGALLLKLSGEDESDEKLYFLEFHRDQSNDDGEPADAWLVPPDAQMTYEDGKLVVDLSEDDEEVKIEFGTANTHIVEDIKNALSKPPNAPANQTQGLIDVIRNYYQNTQSKPPLRLPLKSIVTSDMLSTLGSDPEAVKELKEFMPPQYTDEAHVIKTLKSPQLRETIHKLSSILYSDQLPILFGALGLQLSYVDDNGVAYTDATKVFCDALEKQRH